MPHLVKLTDLYEASDLFDERELMSQFICGADLSRDFIVTPVAHGDLSELLCADGQTKVLEAFSRDATPEQRALVDQKAAAFDADRIILVCDGILLDGYHHVAAAARLGCDVLALDLDQDPELDQTPEV